MLKNEDAGFGKTYVEISGSDDCKQSAQRLIDDLTGGFTHQGTDQS